MEKWKSKFPVFRSLHYCLTGFCFWEFSITFVSKKMEIKKKGQEDGRKKVWSVWPTYPSGLPVSPLVTLLIIFSIEKDLCKISIMSLCIKHSDDFWYDLKNKWITSIFEQTPYLKLSTLGHVSPFRPLYIYCPASLHKRFFWPKKLLVWILSFFGSVTSLNSVLMTFKYKVATQSLCRTLPCIIFFLWILTTRV